MNIIPATKHLKVAPHAVMHFLSKNHTADKHGILHNVPHDTAVILIKNGSATEATADDLAPTDANDVPAEVATAPVVIVEVPVVIAAPVEPVVAEPTSSGVPEAKAE